MNKDNVNKAASEGTSRPQKKTKEEIIRERKLNASMIVLPKKNQEQLGILAVQPDKNIFSLTGKKYMKIYSLKGVELTETRKKILIGELCRLSKSRMRISTFSYANSPSPIIFLSVFFEGNSYADVAEEIDAFDKSLMSLMDSKFKLSFLVCGIGDVFMFIYMNYNGQMKKVSSKSILKKSAHLKKSYFQMIKEQEAGYIIPQSGKLGKSYIGIQFPDKMEQPLNTLKRLGNTYLSSIDFQVVDHEYASYYERMIEDSYGNSGEGGKGKLLLNFSFMFTYLCDSEMERKMYDAVVKKYFADNALVASPCNGSEQKVVDSISTFGLFDMHCCRNVNIDIISKLFG